MMIIHRTTTGVIIKNPSMEVKQCVLKYFSLQKPTREFFIYSGNDPDKKPIFGKSRDVLYISSGFLKLKDPTVQTLPPAIKIEPPVPAKIDLKVDKEPRSQLQKDCIDKLTAANSTKVTVELKPGTGKLEPYSRKIPTPTEQGWTLMGDLKEGDYVFGRDGKLTEILKIFEQGEVDIYKVTFADGRVAYCGKEHLWTVKTYKGGQWKTVTTEDMMGNFKRIAPWKERIGRKDPYVYKYYIPMCEPVDYPHRDVNIDPWVLGCFIGNGCCTNRQLTYSSGTSEIPNRIAEICGFNVKKKLDDPKDYSYVFYHKDGTTVQTAEFFADYPEFDGCYSQDKRIPIDYLYNDIESRYAILRGLLDTDGCIQFAGGRYNVGYTSTSLGLLQDIQTLVYSLGFSTGKIVVDSRDSKYSNGFCGSLHIKVSNDIKPKLFSVSNKLELAIEASQVTKNDIFDDLLIKNIEYSHREQARCIMVDNDEHLYLTEDYVVTHNTFIALYSISKIGYKPLIIVPTTLLKNQWIDNLVESGIPENDIAKNIYESPEKKFCVVTISALENELRDNWHDLMNCINESHFGIKIVDESHLHMKGVLKFDAISNIKHNWYLSATLGRSDQLEDSILNRALADADRFIGNAQYDEYTHKYVNVLFQDIWYNPSTRLCEEHFTYGTKGLVRSTYYNMLMHYHDGVPFINNIITLIKRANGIKTYDGKILLLVPLIEIIDMVMARIKNDPWFKDKSVASVDGSMPLPARQVAMEKDIILSTSMSMGTGVDIQNLAVVVNFDQYSSPIINEQIVGRLRDRGKETWYIDICDHVKQAKSIENWGRKRRNNIPYFPGVKTEMQILPKIMC